MSGRIGVALVALSAILAFVVEVPHAQQPASGSQVAPGEVLLKFRPGTTESERNTVVRGRGASLIRRFGTLGVDHVRVALNEDVGSALAAFRRLAAIDLAQPNFIRRPVGSAPPNDPYWLYGLLWGLERIQAPSVWTSYTIGDSNVVVADIDTGVNYNHPDLAANMWTNPGEIPNNHRDDDGNGHVDDVFGIDTINDDGDPMDDQGHGTHTAGTIAATGDNGTGIVGVAWGAKILACKFIDAAGLGTDAGAIACFDYIVAMKHRGINIRVTNNSWGSARQDPPAAVLQAAIDAAGNAGILNVFAAGNDGADNDATPFDPASFTSPSIVSVAASNDTDARAQFSNYGATSVDLAAPGESILSTYGTTYAFSSGTSMAAPHVSGAAALLVSKIPTLPVDTTKALLMQTSDRLPQWAGKVASGGRLNVSNAATAAGVNIPPAVTLTSPLSGDAFGVSTSITLAASASDLDGSIAAVAFYAGASPVGTVTTGTGGLYSLTWSVAIAGSYTLTAVATDNGGASRTSNPVTISVTPPPGRRNVALAANGGVAAASSTYGTGYPASSVINGDRKGLSWGSGGGWADGTNNTWPDWVEVQFNGSQVVEEINVFTVQDSYASPGDPTLGMTFTKYGIQDFVVQYWTGSDWEPVPGGVITGNALVWRQFFFAPIATSRIRVLVNKGLASNSRVTEVEAYAVLGTENAAPSVALTSPASGGVFPASTPIALEATASDSDGTIAQVDFYANGAPVATSTTGGAGVYTATWVPAVAGSYTVTAVAVDDRGATRMSSPVSVTVTPLPGRTNVALAANGGLATASSTYGTGYPVSSVINGDRKGLGWGSGGGWADGTNNTWPDWVEVQFNGSQAIEEIDVFTVQDAYASPSDPTLGMTFTKYGVPDFVVQYWTGSDWQAVPGGVVTGNTFVWRQFSFAAIATPRIRVWVNRGLAANSRLTEIEAYAVLGNENAPPTVALTSPASAGPFPVSTPIALEATATDADGTISKVDFYANAVYLATGTPAGSGRYTATWTPTAAGTYALTAVAVDDRGAAQTSSATTISVGRTNVALAGNGGVAVASSTYSAGYPASSVINGDRKGSGWGNGGGWADGTTGAWPDWLEVQFNGTKLIDEVDLFTVQDNYLAPAEPTPAMTFTKYGVQDFVVQYWTGSEWQAVPGAGVTGNTLVWRKFSFAPIATTRIRVLVSRGLASNSRLTEVEVYASSGS